MVRRSGTLTLARVSVNGRALDAVLDSGSVATLVSRRALAREGVAAVASSKDGRFVGRDSAGSKVVLQGHRFATLTVGPDTAPRPLLAVIATLPLGDALLGLDVLKTRRIWMEAGTGTVMLSRPAAP